MTKYQDNPIMPQPETSYLVSTIQLNFNLPLTPAQIPAWRGAVAASAGWDKDAFHNHQGSQSAKTVHYRYPQVHYRSEGGRAAIWAWGDGVTAVQQWINNTDLAAFRMNGKPCPLMLTNFQQQDQPLAQTSEWYTYRLLDWLALNQDNYTRWQALPTLMPRIRLLEEILTGQILGFATANDWQVPERFTAELVNLKRIRPVKVHGDRRMAFNVLFRAPLRLPSGMALGRSVAFGFGVQMPIRSQ